MPDKFRSLNSTELKVLEVVLRETISPHQLPIHRFTEADGPNQWGLGLWAIPSTLSSLGEVRVIDEESEDFIRFRRPRIDGQLAEITLEFPHEVVHYRLACDPTKGWELG